MKTLDFMVFASVRPDSLPGPMIPLQSPQLNAYSLFHWYIPGARVVFIPGSANEWRNRYFLQRL